VVLKSEEVASADASRVTVVRGVVVVLCSRQIAVAVADLRTERIGAGNLEAALRKLRGQRHRLVGGRFRTVWLVLGTEGLGEIEECAESAIALRITLPEQRRRPLQLEDGTGKVGRVSAAKQVSAHL